MSTRATVDWNLVLQNVGDDPEMLDEVIDLFAEMAPDLLAKVLSCFAAGDVREMRDAVHRLRGCVLMFAEGTVAPLAEKIEQRASAGALANPDDVGAFADAVSALRAEVDAQKERRRVAQ